MSTPNFFSDYLAAWDTLDVDAVMAFFTDDIEYRDTTIGHGAKGAKQMRRFVEASFTNVAHARFDYVGHVATEEDYAIEWVMQPMGVGGVSIGALRDGKICKNRDYWDGAKFKVPNT
jgi:ketosteroid isomerase-like protein